MTMGMHDRLANEFGCHLTEDGVMECPIDSDQPRCKKVAVWGSARTPEDSGLYRSIERMGRELAEDGWEVVTGGGPGNMEAANKGALSVCPPAKSVPRQKIYLPFEEAVNGYVQSMRNTKSSSLV